MIPGFQLRGETIPGTGPRRRVRAAWEGSQLRYIQGLGERRITTLHKLGIVTIAQLTNLLGMKRADGSYPQWTKNTAFFRKLMTQRQAEIIKDCVLTYLRHGPADVAAMRAAEEPDAPAEDFRSSPQEHEIADDEVADEDDEDEDVAKLRAQTDEVESLPPLSGEDGDGDDDRPFGTPATPASSEPPAPREQGSGDATTSAPAVGGGESPAPPSSDLF